MSCFANIVSCFGRFALCFANSELCFDEIVLCFKNTVLCFDNSLLCSDNTMLCLEKCLLCLQIWATVQSTKREKKVYLFYATLHVWLHFKIFQCLIFSDLRCPFFIS